MTTRYQILATGGVFDHQKKKVVLYSKSDPDWIEYQAWVSAGGEPLKADSIGQMTLEDAKAARVAEIDLYAAGLRNSVIRGRSAGEMASWAMKLMDAMAISAGQPSPFAAMLPGLSLALGLPTTASSINDALAKIRGITEADHIAKVMSQAGQYMVAEIAIDAIRGKHNDYVNSCTDVRDIVTYDWLAGWPTLSV